MNETVEKLASQLAEEIEKIDNLEEKVQALNLARKVLAGSSPFKSEPADCVVWVKSETVHANEYNPNTVAPPEMELLHTSIALDGYTMPIVSCDLVATGEAPKGSGEYYEVVDGFHRNRVGKEYEDVSRRVHGYLPVSLLIKPLEERISATIRHNRARGSHGIRPMSEVVLELARYGWKDERICEQLGMEMDEVLRLKQITGLRDAFQNHEFSKSWEEFEKRYYKK